MQAMRFPEPHAARIVDVPIPEPQATQVLIRVRAAGICHSDVAAFLGKHNVRRPPVITGHELAGEVMAAGAGVRELRPGARVAVEPHLGCGACYYCRRGAYHECPEKRFMGVGEWIGAFAEYVVADETMCHPIPDRMSYEEAAFLEPFCVGLHAVRRAEIRLGESVAVLGVGTIGMATMLAARLAGPGLILVSDLSAAKREAACRLGADLAVDPAAQEVVAAARQATQGVGADVVFVAVAVDRVLQDGLLLGRRMGKLVIVASFFDETGLPAREIQVRERTVLGTSMYTAEDYRLAIRLWEQGRLDFRPLISRRISLAEAPGLIAALAKNEVPDAIKVMIRLD